jgi:hypothetical protein
MRKSQLLSIIARIRRGATSPQNIFDSLNALATNPPYGGTAITTTLPTVLAQGEQVIYRDPNGVQSLWIGNADGEAWPSVGYKEAVVFISWPGSSQTATVTTISDNIGIGEPHIAINSVSFSYADVVTPSLISPVFVTDIGNGYYVQCSLPAIIDGFVALNITFSDYTDTGLEYTLVIRVYP